MEKQKEERKIWLYGFIFLMLGLVLGLLIFNSGLTGQAIFNVRDDTLKPAPATPIVTPSAAIVPENSIAVVNANQEKVQNVIKILSGTTGYIDYNLWSETDWSNLREYLIASSVLEKTFSKKNLGTMTAEQLTVIYNQELAKSKISKESLLIGIQKATGGGGGSSDCYMQRCQAGLSTSFLRYCCPVSFWVDPCTPCYDRSLFYEVSDINFGW
ncbi:hypothetical protein J4465_02085 [Candidatus Pacearchaeota archaeon]|nr:hypothetical protein [Candidatus Pacearchaeota archaeon]